MSRLDPDLRQIQLHQEHFGAVAVFRYGDVGECQLHIYTDDPEVVWLWAFEIYPAHRRKGLGRRMVRAILTQAKRGASKTMSLYVGKDNLAAINLYKSEGFVIEGHAHQGVDYLMTRAL